MSSQSQSTSTLTRDEVTRMANEVVNFFWVWKQRNVPVKRADIIKYVIKDNKAAYNEIFQLAQKKMMETFKHKIQEVGEGNKKGFILLNVLKSETEDAPVIDAGNPKRGVLTFILTIIFMSGGPILEETLWNRLKDMNLVRGVDHPVFGDVKKLFQEFVRQGYLHQEKMPNSTPAQFEYKWGARSYLEVSKYQILKTVSMLHEYSDVSMWKSQYNEAVTEDNAATAST